jgi:hypothetical protein
MINGKKSTKVKLKLKKQIVKRTKKIRRKLRVLVEVNTLSYYMGKTIHGFGVTTPMMKWTKV